MPQVEAANCRAASRKLLPALLTLLLTVPCFWHRHFVAGDLGSHSYNVWLAQLIRAGRAPGLFLKSQTSNILFDSVLAFVAHFTGIEFAARLVAAFSVLVFFWGAFSFISRVARRRPWALTPFLAMFSYGYTFQMGFFNFYLSVGLAFFAISLILRGTRLCLVGAAFLAGLVWLAHPFGFVWMLAAGVYIPVSTALPPRWRNAPLPVGASLLMAAHFYVLRLHPAFWEGERFWLFNGADQLLLFGNAYLFVFCAFLLVTGVCILKARKDGQWCACRSSFDLFTLLVLAAALIPELVVLPQYAAPASFLIVRSTCITAILLLAILSVCGHQQERFLAKAAAICAAVFFALLYRDTGRLDAFASEAEQLVSRLPAGTRLTVTLPAPRDWRVAGLQHMVDQACIGRCFVFSNYEPATGQFRVRAKARNELAASSSADVVAMEEGVYILKVTDPPLTQITWCDERVEHSRLCARPLAAVSTDVAASRR